MKNLLLIFFVFITVLFLSRGFLFRELFSYKSRGERTNYWATDSKLIELIEKNIDKETEYEVPEIVQLTLSITSNHLAFTSGKNHKDPNNLVSSNTAHCVGYASFFATTCNYLLKKYNLNENWIAKPQIGQLYLFNTNIHEYFDASFFKDHDFVLVTNKESAEVISIDPSIHDYFLIDKVTFIK